MLIARSTLPKFVLIAALALFSSSLSSSAAQADGFANLKKGIHKGLSEAKKGTAKGLDKAKKGTDKGLSKAEKGINKGLDKTKKALSH